MPYIKLKNYAGQVLKGMSVKAPKGAVVFDKIGKKIVLSQPKTFLITHNNRKGINKYRINLLDKKTGRKYWQMNYAMDDDKSDGHSIWSLSSKPMSDKEILDKYGYKVKDGKRIRNKLAIRIALDILAKEKPQTLFEGLIYETKEMLKDQKELAFNNARSKIYNIII